ncbi:hypothetical protein PMIN07_010543 [Paraphaeosphaeria minitans]
MTSLFPHTTHAEDQPSAHAILYLHVWRATTMTCTFAAQLTAPASLLLSRYRHGTRFTGFAYGIRLLVHSARGLVIGSILGFPATYVHMFGREEIEWQDRAWRLQENREEELTDLTTLMGMVVAPVAFAATKARGRLGIGMTLMGGIGVGAGTGMIRMIRTFAQGRNPV